MSTYVFEFNLSNKIHSSMKIHHVCVSTFHAEVVISIFDRLTFKVTAFKTTKDKLKMLRQLPFQTVANKFRTASLTCDAFSRGELSRKLPAGNLPVRLQFMFEEL